MSPFQRISTSWLSPDQKRRLPLPPVFGWQCSAPLRRRASSQCSPWCPAPLLSSHSSYCQLSGLFFASSEGIKIKLIFCYFSFYSLDLYLLGIKSIGPVSKCSSCDCSLPNIHQLRSYCHKLRAIRVQRRDWFKFAEPVIGSVPGLWLVAVTMDFRRPRLFPL